MARAAVCLAALFLAVAVFVPAASDPLTAVQPGHATTGGASSLPAHRGEVKEEEAVDKAAQAAGDLASLESAEEQGQKLVSDWGKKKKLDDNDSDSDSDSDQDSDSDSDSDHDSDTDHDSDSDSDDDGDKDDDDHSKNGTKKKKQAAPGRKGASDGKEDDELPEAAIKV